jgi:hypothetical protein
MSAKFAEVAWSAEDVQALRPSWPLERCEEELAASERHLRDRVIEHGWQVLDCLLPAEGE